jgi:tetratricopeptide (TPR) repeat protein
VLFPLVQSAVIATFFVVGRYRIAAVPPLLALAAVGIVSLWTRARARHWRAAGILGLVAAGVFTASLANPWHVRPDSGFGQCHYRQGVELDRIGRLEDAEQEYRACLARDPDYAPAHMNLGGVLARSGRSDQAGHEFAEAVRLDPGYARAHYNLGAHLEETGGLKEAAGAYRRALELDPAWALPREGLARVAYLQGDLDGAGRLFREEAAAPGVRDDPDHATRGDAGAYLDLVAKRRVLLHRMGGREPGGQAWTELLAADMLIASGSTAQAEARYETAAQAPGAVAARGAACYELGTLAYARRDLPRARALFENAAHLWDDQPNLHFALGNVALLSGDPRRAVEEFRREIALDPRHAPSWLNLGVCYENALGDLSAARAAYERYVELGGDRSDDIRRRLVALPPANP